MNMKKEDFKKIEKKNYKRYEVYHINVNSIEDSEISDYLDEIAKEFTDKDEEDVKYAFIPIYEGESTVEIYNLITDEILEKLNKIEEKLDRMNQIVN